MTALLESVEEPLTDVAAVVQEIRRLHVEAMRNAWLMGKLLGRLNKAEHLWKPIAMTWRHFCARDLGLTAQYTYKLIDVAANFTEAQVAACGSAKLIKILPVPVSDRRPFVQLAKSGASVKEVSAEVNRYMVEHSRPMPGGGRELPAVRETGRKGAHRVRFTKSAITHLDAREQVVELFAAADEERRAKTAAESPVGHFFVSGRAYRIAVRSTPAGLVAGIKADE